MDTKYFEVKTDTQSVTTDNVALEIQIVHPTKKTIGCALKTFPAYLFYRIYPTNRLLYWNPSELNPYIIDWVDEKKYKAVAIGDSFTRGVGSIDYLVNGWVELTEKNLNIVSKKFKVSPKNLILLKQIHSNKCHFILKRPSKKLVDDGLITTKKNLALGILTADCAPVLIYDKKLPMIAAIHVGWKGAFKNILKKCIKFMIKKGSENQNISAVIGPSIFRENYEVKRNFMKKFLNLNSRNRKFFYFKKSRIFFNLKEFIKSQLRSLKINNIDIINKDTF